ncbi:bifunctional UDP-N-acetylmuramoyl-tripeptide:D-alanyl-D-alanine ligase/alanine racemase [Ferruginibacter sp. HRS2-29]|uniref:bifunctional UDP-N-acetylmuramoyl-tripeptide:D-alanyl-D-alanine ligase/alanine racemase n=1 Tax=Ferruginibacter sp. HRS2-29 TaxID=2487334 RepID=UPI0020CC92AF|nr:bifunctional UDP-N-acetylmuramoyl-tripeptide:D-alanyl-D-alanine ligase/alanine racemase [Ferruginibacter sp. HRS2-29]
MRYTINQIAAATGSSEIFEEDAPIEQLLIDSRKVHFPATSLFFALTGPVKDGHTYIPELYEKGIRNFVVSQPVAKDEFPGARFITVTDTLNSLQQVAAWHRRNFSFPVIGITGSNGKTIVKELLYQLLNSDYTIVRSPKSYNSQIGVPLSVWQMSNEHTLGIFEAGISLPGEMEKLQKVIDPGTGIFTFIGDAHASGFSGIRQKIEEKLSLFAKSKLLFYNKDEKLLDDVIKAFVQDKNQGLQLFTWGKNKDASVVLQSVKKLHGDTLLECTYGNEVFDFTIPFTDDASIHNALTCCCVLIYLKFPAVIISQRMAQLKPVEMRLELKQGNNNCSIINDGYSADINSLGIALDFLQQQQQHEKKTVVLSDMMQGGQDGRELYQQIATMVTGKSIDRFIGVGPEIKENAHLFSTIPNNSFFISTEEFLAQVPVLNFRDETILLKGARVFEFERISNVLEQKTHQTLLEINLNALRHNLDAYRRQLNPGVKLMAMVKAFSYGSGSFEIANILQHAGVDYLAVAYADEGVELRKAGIRLPIMVMNVESDTFNSLVKYNLEPELYSFNILDAFRQYLQQHQLTHYPVHIKLDTGMHRLGFEEHEADGLVTILKDTDVFHIRSVFSHLVASGDSKHDAFTKQQAEIFEHISQKISAVIKEPFIKHISNTSGIARLPVLQLDMVRLGIGLYGVDSNPVMQEKLRTVATLKTTIAQIKHIKKGETVGYNRQGVVLRDSVIATVRIGYADGYRRSLGNGKGHMYINGQLAPVIGNVCMDMTMLDITDIPASEEDDVIVFGEALPVDTVANAAETIAYEILTSISQRVKRVYFEE